MKGARSGDPIYTGDEGIFVYNMYMVPSSQASSDFLFDLYACSYNDVIRHADCLFIHWFSFSLVLWLNFQENTTVWLYRFNSSSHSLLFQVHAMVHIITPFIYISLCQVHAMVQSKIQFSIIIQWCSHLRFYFA